MCRLVLANFGLLLLQCSSVLCQFLIFMYHYDLAYPEGHHQDDAYDLGCAHDDGWMCLNPQRELLRAGAVMEVLWQSCSVTIWCMYCVEWNQILALPRCESQLATLGSTGQHWAALAVERLTGLAGTDSVLWQGHRGTKL